MRNREQDLAAVAAAALTWNRARLVRIARAKAVNSALPWLHPLRMQAEAGLTAARQQEAQAKAALRKACTKADPATLTIDAEPLPAGALVYDVQAKEVTR